MLYDTAYVSLIVLLGPFPLGRSRGPRAAAAFSLAALKTLPGRELGTGCSRNTAARSVSATHAETEKINQHYSDEAMRIELERSG